MLSQGYINQISREAAEHAAQDGLTPHVVWPEDLELWQCQYENDALSLPFPHIGDMEPAGFELQRTLFVDMSGFGEEGGPAMTVRRLIYEELAVDMAYAIVEVGQFQLHLGEFSKLPRRPRLKRDPIDWNSLYRGRPRTKV